MKVKAQCNLLVISYKITFTSTLFQMVVVETLTINKAIAVVNAVNFWLLEPNPNYVLNLGIRCNGMVLLNNPYKKPVT